MPRNFRIELHGAGHAGEILEPAAALDALYLGEGRFFRVVDVAVIAVGKHLTRVFVRASGHRPGPFEQTWNDPSGSGPFRQLIAEQIGVIAC